MKTNELNACGFEEINVTEMKETDGGWLLPLLAGALIAGIITDWPGFKRGVSDGFNDN